MLKIYYIIILYISNDKIWIFYSSCITSTFVIYGNDVFYKYIDNVVLMSGLSISGLLI